MCITHMQQRKGCIVLSDTGLHRYQIFSHLEYIFEEGLICRLFPSAVILVGTNHFLAFYVYILYIYFH